MNNVRRQEPNRDFWAFKVQRGVEVKKISMKTKDKGSRALSSHGALKAKFNHKINGSTTAAMMSKAGALISCRVARMDNSNQEKHKVEASLSEAAYEPSSQTNAFRSTLSLFDRL